MTTTPTRTDPAWLLPSADQEPSARTPRPRRWLWPVVVLLAWFALGGALAAQAGNLGTVVESGATSYLPSNSQSKLVTEQTEAFGDEVALPATVVWTRPGGLTAADEQQVANRLEEARGDLAAGLTRTGVIGPLPSEDGEAVQAVFPFAGSDTEVVAEQVEQLRLVLAPADGLEVAVTGPAGVQADMQEALGAIDVMLISVTSVVILVILFAVYRSLLLPFLVIAIGGLALGSALGAIYLLAKADVVDIGAEVQGIISVLVLGCATDYAILLTARYATQLRAGEPPAAAMRVAWRSTVEPVVASAATVILGLLCLLLSDLGLNRQLGPAAAIGVFFAMLAMLTLMPAVLLLLGRAAFWPRTLTPQPSGGSRLWTRVAALLDRRPRLIWVTTALLLAACATGVLRLNAGGLSDGDMVIGSAVESRTGQQLLDDHFPGAVGSPAVVLVDADAQEEATSLLEGVPGVDSVQAWTGATGPAAADAPARVVEGRVRLDATLTSAPDSAEAQQTVRELRSELAGLADADEPTLVGGQAAVKVDFNEAAISDRWVLLLLLGVVLLVVGLLLRSVVAALVVVASVVLSFLAAMGVATIVFQDLLGFPGVDATFPIHAFVFLVALGVDYSIFLMSRVRERVLETGPHQGVLEGLMQTSGVITSAGLVLAATFAALGLVPLVLMVQLAFIVAFGVILDTVVVRSLLVPALALDLDRHMWWPNPRLSRRPAPVARRALL
ncbi:MMPL family transporter [Microlunatus lacustris]